MIQTNQAEKKIKKMEFDNTEAFEKYVRPAWQELILQCDEYNIPMFISLAMKGDAKHTEYKREMLSASSRDMELAEDEIVKYAAVADGFEVVPFRETRGFIEEMEVVEED